MLNEITVNYQDDRALIVCYVGLCYVILCSTSHVCCKMNNKKRALNRILICIQSCFFYFSLTIITVSSITSKFSPECLSNRLFLTFS